MRYKVLFSYDGTQYAGYQIQPNALTIQGTVEKILSTLLNATIKTYASGRTDAGVHALGQCLHFDYDKVIMDKDRLLYSLNAVAPKDIHFLSLEVVDESFHARFSCQSKVYKYFVNYGRYDLFYRNYSYFYHYPLDFIKLDKTMKLLLGTHCFKNFTSKEEDEDNFVRTIYDVKIEHIDDHLFAIVFEGDGFMRYMVRMLVMNLLEVASNRLSEEEFKQTLDDTTRRITANKAPAHGLFLYSAKY